MTWLRRKGGRDRDTGVIRGRGGETIHQQEAVLLLPLAPVSSAIARHSPPSAALTSNLVRAKQNDSEQGCLWGVQNREGARARKFDGVVQPPSGALLFLHQSDADADDSLSDTNGRQLFAAATVRPVRHVFERV